MKIDPQYKDYEVDFNTILDGIYDYEKSVHVLDGNRCTKIQLYYFRNIAVQCNGQLVVALKNKETDFRDFGDYYNRLLSAMKDLSENGKDPLRGHRYNIVTTISKGYDAPCCAVIGKQVGCETACTFTALGKYTDDCGTDVARQLGYTNIIEKNENGLYQREDCVEAYYLASGELVGASFVCFDSEFEGNLVLMGDRGDSVWDRDKVIVNDRFRFIDVLSHIGFCEARLWVGYVHVPLPLFGASAWISIQRIAKSEEMRKWSLGGNYDRPIPRRIVEDAGVKRESFGQNKHGAGFIYRYDPYKRIKKRMSGNSAKSFEAYVNAHRNIKISERLSYYWKMRSIYLRKLGIKISGIETDDVRKIANPNEVRYLFPWSIEYLIGKYSQILTQDFSCKGNKKVPTA